MNKNLFINIILAIICLYLLISNIKNIQNNDLSLYNKIIKIFNSSISLLILFYILYLYKNGIAGITLLNLVVNSTDNQLVNIINNFANIFSLGFIGVYSFILFIYCISKNFSEFTNFIKSGESYNALKIVPTLYKESSQPCIINMDLVEENEENNESFENFENIEHLTNMNDKEYKYKNNDIECPPLSFYNNKMKDYQNLKLCDFYYNSSFNTMISTSNDLSTLNISNLNKNIYPVALNGNNARLIHLQVYSSGDLGDENSYPMISTNSLNQYSEPIDFNNIIKYLNNNIFKNPYSENCILPFFIYLEIKFDKTDVNIYNKIALSLKNIFGNKLVSKKYGFNGRSGNYPVSNCPIKDAFGKVIIFTDNYPTYSLSDEYINLNVKDKSQCNYVEYDSNYIKYDTGLSTKYSTNSLIEMSRTKFTFVVPKISKDNIFNSDINDCLKYGIQFVLYNPFYLNDKYQKIDESNSKILTNFKTKWNSILLKNISFRYIEEPKLVIKKQKDYLKMNNVKTIKIIPSWGPTTQKSGFN